MNSPGSETSSGHVTMQLFSLVRVADHGSHKAQPKVLTRTEEKVTEIFHVPILYMLARSIHSNFRAQEK